MYSIFILCYILVYREVRAIPWCHSAAVSVVRENVEGEGRIVRRVLRS